jgi:hypothetical protein
VKVKLHSLTFKLGRGEWSASRSDSFVPKEELPVSSADTWHGGLTMVEREESCPLQVCTCDSSEISGSHGGEDVDGGLIGCDAM